MSNTPNVILEVNKISNSYEGESVLDDISFSLQQGEILCLLGPSGSGKTTLLRVIAGLESEDKGTIIYRNRNLKNIVPHRRNIGMMFQDYALFPHKDVWKNVAFGLEMQGTDSQTKSAKITRILDLVGLQNLARRRVDELSGGEKQRVALARSLVPEPGLLLLDEPLGSLDRTLRDRLTTEIRRILKELEVTAIFVTHDQTEAFSVADKVAILHRGVLQQFGTPEQIYRYPVNSTVAGFLGFKNVLPLEVLDGDEFSDLRFSLARRFGETALSACKLLLIRPDGIRLPAVCDKSDSTPKISGIVRERHFQGSTYRLSVALQSLLLSFDVPLEPSPAQTEDIIELTIHPEAVILLRN